METEHDIIYRADQAKALLKDPLLKDAFESCKKTILKTWETTPARDAEAREWLWKMYQASMRFEEVFKGYIDSGTVAREKLKQYSMKDRIKAVL